jgi:Tfp pilus assembly protein FimT
MVDREYIFSFEDITQYQGSEQPPTFRNRCLPVGDKEAGARNITLVGGNCRYLNVQNVVTPPLVLKDSNKFVPVKQNNILLFNLLT